MSEADLPNAQDLPEPVDSVNSIEPVPPADPADLPVHSSPSTADDWQTVNFPNAISVDAISSAALDEGEAASVEESEQEQAIAEIEALAALIGEAPVEDIENSPSTVLSLSPAPELEPELEIVVENQQLHQQNLNLLNRVAQLEEALEEYQGAFQHQIGRSREQESVLAQQTQDLTAAQETITRLLHELEFTQQTAQRQQILVETLTGQLETSQERVAQLERDCALTQQRYNEHIHLLLQSENTCRDLRSRLCRQQRYTLQFKAALKKCLEVPPPSYEANLDPATPPTAKVRREAKVAPASQAVLPKVQPIQPWSAAPGFLQDEEALDSILSSREPAQSRFTAADFPETCSVSIATESDPVWLSTPDPETASSKLQFPATVTANLQTPVQPPFKEDDAAAIAFESTTNSETVREAPSQFSISYNLKQRNPLQSSIETDTEDDSALMAIARLKEMTHPPAPNSYKVAEDTIMPAASDEPVIQSPDLSTSFGQSNLIEFVQTPGDTIHESSIFATGAVDDQSILPANASNSVDQSSASDLPISGLEQEHLLNAPSETPIEPLDLQSLELDDFDLDVNHLDVNNVNLESTPVQLNAQHFLAQDVSESEEALWQDLAQLIDTPTHSDTPNNSTVPGLASGNPMLRSQTDPADADTPNSDPAFHQEPETQPMPTAANSSGPALDPEGNSQGIAAAFQASWPSPTLHPLRNRRKLQSLAAIDLPSFPRYRD